MVNLKVFCFFSKQFYVINFEAELHEAKREKCLPPGGRGDFYCMRVVCTGRNFVYGKRWNEIIIIKKMNKTQKQNFFALTFPMKNIKKTALPKRKKKTTVKLLLDFVFSLLGHSTTTFSELLSTHVKIFTRTNAIYAFAFLDFIVCTSSTFCTILIFKTIFCPK